MRLDRYLANSGLGTRKEVKSYIKKGLIRVNNEIIKSDGFNIDEYKDEIFFQDEKIQYHEFYYILLNKPLIPSAPGVILYSLCCFLAFRQPF